MLIVCNPESADEATSGVSNLLNLASLYWGAAAVVALWLLLPAARKLDTRAAWRGFAVGVCASMAVHVLLSLLCWRTAMCLRL